MEGFCNPGGDQGKVEPTIMTSDEILLSMRIQDAQAEVKKTEAAAVRARNALGELQVQCTHRVFRDEGGIEYSQRHCCICGGYLGLV